MADRREGGSVSGFIIVAIILIGLLLGGAYFLSQQNHPGPTIEAPVSEQPSSGGEQQPVESMPPEALPQAPAIPSNTPPPQATHLPQSGPSDGILTAICIGFSTLVLFSYLRSRRQLTASLTYWCI